MVRQKTISSPKILHTAREKCSSPIRSVALVPAPTCIASFKAPGPTSLNPMRTCAACAPNSPPRRPSSRSRRCCPGTSNPKSWQGWRRSSVYRESHGNSSGPLPTTRFPPDIRVQRSLLFQSNKGLTRLGLRVGADLDESGVDLDRESRKSLVKIILTVALVAPLVVHADAPPPSPSESRLIERRSYINQGTCSHHGGVSRWLD
jgi:hypothetical protein